MRKRTKRWTASLAVALALSACAGHRKDLAEVVVPPPVMPTLPTTPRLMSGINAGLSPAATIWHLRTGLNVAALACRGGNEGAIVASYNALLTTHKAGLAAAENALADEYKAIAPRDWQDRYDDAMTRLYNFWSRTEAREAFCRTAAALLSRVQALPPGALADFAAANLPALDAPFARQPTTVLAFAPRMVAVQPVARMQAVSASVSPEPARRKPLELDLSTLPVDP